MGKFSLYVHIPFCTSKCDYCDFFSTGIGLCKSVPDDYVDCVVKEVKTYARIFGVQEWNTVYIGGGTPSLLSPVQLNSLFDGIQKSCKGGISCGAEVTVEMNPESLDKELLSAADSCGVNRLSLGIQSLNSAALLSVRRNCTVQKAQQALELVKKCWKNDLSLDAIAGLPEQNSEEFALSLKKMLSYEPQHFSLYTLTVEEGTPLCKKIDNGMEWNADEADSQWLLGRDILFSHGFSQYEVSNFCLAGKESRHNSAYWQQQSYIGAGAGASGTVYCGSEGLRWNVKKDVKAYIDFWKTYRASSCDGLSFEQLVKGGVPLETENLDAKTMEFEFLMMGLRTRQGVSAQKYERLYSGVSPWNGNLSLRLGEKNGVWRRFYDEGMTNVYSSCGGETFYALNEKGILFLNRLLVELD